MIRLIPNVAVNVAAFEAVGEVHREDFENIVLPEVETKVQLFDELNYLLLLNTDVQNFSFGAWIQDALLGLKNLTKWNRVAIVTDQESVQNFTAVFSVLMPGEFKFFPQKDLANALFWCENGNEENE